MKKIIAFLTINIFLFVFNNPEVNAECTYTEKANLNKLAANVKVDYEIKSEEKDMTGIEGYLSMSDPIIKVDYININIINISPELYIEQSDLNTSAMITLGYSDAADGLISQRIDDLSFVRKYTFKVYGSSESACPNTSLKTINLTVPRYNKYSERTICDTETEFYLCKRYVTSSEITEDKFLEKLYNYQDGKTNKNGIAINESKKPYEKVIDFISQYKYLIGGIVIVAFTTGIVIRVIKIKKQRELGL